MPHLCVVNRDLGVLFSSDLFLRLSALFRFLSLKVIVKCHCKKADSTLLVTKSIFIFMSCCNPSLKRWCQLVVCPMSIPVL